MQMIRKGVLHGTTLYMHTSGKEKRGWVEERYILKRARDRLEGRETSWTEIER